MSEENVVDTSDENASDLNEATVEKKTAEAQAQDLKNEDIEDAELDEETLEAAEQAAAELTEEERQERIAFLKPIVEGAIMAVGETINLKRLQSIFDEHEIPSKGLLIEVLELIQQDCENRGFELVEVASGWRFQVRDENATWVNRLWEERPQKYSRALLETLALIAYRQPLTRGDIEEVRGVAVSSHIIKTLTEREWVKVVGHRDVPGRPALYATTKSFLDYFNLKSLDELPTLGELRDIESLNASLDLDAQLPPEMIAEMKAQDEASDGEAPAENTEGQENAEVEIETDTKIEANAESAQSTDAQDVETVTGEVESVSADEGDENTISSDSEESSGESFVQDSEHAESDEVEKDV